MTSNSLKEMYKSLLCSVAFILCSCLGFSQEPSNRSISVTIANIKNDSGKVVLSLHTSETFMKSAGIQSLSSDIKDGKVTIVFKNIKPGEYALMALHDANENNRMDFDAQGMPIESYGMSNNPMSYGPPQYDDAKFNLVSEDIKLNIRF